MNLCSNCLKQERKPFSFFFSFLIGRKPFSWFYKLFKKIIINNFTFSLKEEHMPVSSIVWSSKNWKFPIPEKPIYFTFPTSTIKIFFKKKKKNLQQSKKDNPPSIISTFFFFLIKKIMWHLMALLLMDIIQIKEEIQNIYNVSGPKMK